VLEVLAGDVQRLEGAAGVPDAMIRLAVANGIRKINVDSDLRIAFTAGLRETVVRDHKNIDPRKWMARSKQLMQEVVRHKMELFDSKGKA